MTLLSPVALAWLLLVPVLVLLHLRRRAKARRPVSNLFLWRTALDRSHTRPHLSRLLTNLQLLLQIAFVVAATLALAGPVVSCGGGSRIAFVIDTSASMQAVHDGRSRLDTAREAALERLGDLRRTDAVAIIAAGDTVHIRAPMTTDRGQARAAIAGLTAGTGSADLDGALALAWSSADPSPDHVIVFTDISAPQPAPDASRRIEVIRTGAPAGNVAVTRLAVRRHPGSGFDGQVLAAVANFGDSPARVPLHLVQDRRELHAGSIALAPGGRRVIVIDIGDTSSAVSARIDVHDALSADDETTAAVAPPARVAVIGSASRYVRAALAANPLLTLVDAPEDADVAVCEGCSADSTAAALLILQNAGGAMSRLTVADRDHPAVSFTAFEDLVVAASPVPIAAHARVLVTANGAPVVTAFEEAGGRRRVIHAGLDVTRGPLPSSSAFPIFVANAVEWLRGDPAAGDARTVPASESDLRARHDARAAAGADGATGRVAEASLPLWRAAVGAALVILAFHTLRFGRRTRSPLRVATAVLLIAGAAGFDVAAGAARRHVVFVLDASASMAAAERDRAARLVSEFLAQAQPGDEASVVAFGREPLVEARRVRRIDAAALASQPDGSGSDIAAALRLARSLAQPGARIVLVSDGNETRGDARAEARQLAAGGVPVDVVPPRADAPARPEVLVARVDAAAGARARQPFEIAAEIAATVPQAATVRLLQAGRVAGERRLDLVRGATRVAFTQRADAGGLLRYDVEVIAERDATAANNRASALVDVRGPARVLYVSAAAAPAGATLLRRHGLHVVHGRPAAIPRAPSALDAFDAVVLDDVPARAVDAGQRDALARYVEEDAGGLVVTGVRSFGPGGWTGTRVERLLPVDMRPPGRRDASESALVLVLDKSGSMADVENGSRKIDIAIRAAAPLVDLFAASRTIGVLAFDTSVVPLLRLGDAAGAGAMLDRMRELAAGGGTTIAPAVNVAREWLLASRARRRHIVLLSDGRSSPEDRAALLEAAAAGGVTISTVGVGRGVEAAGLTAIAERSGGRAYFPGTLAELPEIFMQEATLAAGMWRVDEPFGPAAETPHAILRDVDVAALGRVGGYVATTARPSAEVVLASHRRDPLLVGWTRGIGRAAVFTTDLQSSWTDALRATPAFAQMWAQTVRWTARPRDTGRLHPDVAMRGTTVTMAVGAFTREGGFLNALDVRAAIDADAGARREIVMPQVAPGRYEADPLELPPGFHTLRITAAGGGTEHAVVTGVNVSAAPEHAAAGPNRALLADVARLSGGALLADGESPFARAAVSRRMIDTSGILIAAAMLLFVADAAFARGFFGRRSRRPAPKAAAA